IRPEFQKADSDLDYIQYRLEYEIKTNYPDSAGKKNPVTLLKELSAIKSRYQTLQVRFKPIAVEQKETKSRICATFSKTMTLIQELQKQTDLELLPLTEEEKTAAEQLRAHLNGLAKRNSDGEEINPINLGRFPGVTKSWTRLSDFTQFILL
uniref:Protein FAM33A n=1 Tax=Capra hircus TaxID=9925 RepID=A0A452G061_CAPHI